MMSDTQSLNCQPTLKSQVQKWLGVEEKSGQGWLPR